MNSELFLFGNPRLLSNGGTSTNNATYDAAPPATGNTVVTSKYICDAAKAAGRPLAGADSRFIINELSIIGQQVHRGRDSYHARSWHSNSCSTRMNSFITNVLTSRPTLGVEIETYVRPEVSISAALGHLYSNWFHFEEDGSLDRLLGHELITEVLPPRAYRDIRLWTGLQNTAAPYLESWKHETTGLHVHVGVDQFSECDSIPYSSFNDRVMVGKLLTAYVYYGLYDQSFVSKVMLRKSSTYCRSDAPKWFTDCIRADSSVTTAGDIIDAIAANSAPESGSGADYVAMVLRTANVTAVGNAATGDAARESTSFVKSCAFARFSANVQSSPEFSEHHSELNMDHKYTIEFRRGKGTLNAISVHRMVEFASLTVRYAWHLARNPGERVERKSVYEYIIRNTTSEALRKLAAEYVSDAK